MSGKWSQDEIAPDRKRVLEDAKDELRKLFDREPSGS